MQLSPSQIHQFNEPFLSAHKRNFERIKEAIPNAEEIVSKLQAFKIAIPSWALGTGGTRFGRFPGGGEPRNLEEKLEDIGLLHQLTKSCGAISLHIPWDIPENSSHIKSLAASYGIHFDAMNSNTFQDQ